MSEMITSDTSLWQSSKSRNRLQYEAMHSPHIVQIAGSCPKQLAQAARSVVELGADIVDINMGCPAKKVCRKAAGSALLRDSALVESILRNVVNSVSVPVTLKYRTGWSPESRNAVDIAKLAEDVGIAALTLHGRTRACRFNGDAEYETIAQVVEAVGLPVIANGDIDSAHKAQWVLEKTGAKGVMIGRAARGNPWIFGQINSYLIDGTVLARPSYKEVFQTMQQHLEKLHVFYGELMGVRIARKHLTWYLEEHFNLDHDGTLQEWRREFNQLTQIEEQSNAVSQLSERQQQLEDQAA